MILVLLIRRRGWRTQAEREEEIYNQRTRTRTVSTQFSLLPCLDDLFLCFYQNTCCGVANCRYWQSAGEREGENPMKTPLPYIIIFGMSTPFVILAIAFANGWIKVPVR
jgi:hypothetical protein